jgi:hypothetical protein
VVAVAAGGDDPGSAPEDAFVPAVVKAAGAETEEGRGHRSALAVVHGVVWPAGIAHRQAGDRAVQIPYGVTCRAGMRAWALAGRLGGLGAAGVSVHARLFSHRLAYGEVSV